MFQFLIGRLAIDTEAFDYWRDWPGFQFLIGRLAMVYLKGRVSEGH